MMLVHLTCAGNVELTVHGKILAIYRSVALGTIYCGVLCWGGATTVPRTPAGTIPFFARLNRPSAKTRGHFMGLRSMGSLNQLLCIMDDPSAETEELIL